MGWLGVLWSIKSTASFLWPHAHLAFCDLRQANFHVSYEDTAGALALLVPVAKALRARYLYFYWPVCVMVILEASTVATLSVIVQV